MSHTPGPWTLAKTYAPYTYECTGCENDYPGATITIPSATNGDRLHHEAIEVWGEHAEADARLISAAPDLLALLKRIAGWDHMDGAADGAYWRNEIAAVIAKAEGK